MNTFKRLAGKLLVGTLALWLATSSVHAADAPAPLLVFAAASLTNALDEINKAYTQETKQEVKSSYAASSTLARQLEAGAQADVFFSADTEWMDYLQNRNLIDTGTRKNLLGNKLVLIAPADSTVQLKIANGFALAATLGEGRLSTGDPDSVPAGKYARAALTSLGVWDQVADRLVRADSVRTALAFVDRGEAPLGIVYETDALIDKKVRVVDTFPSNTHPAIVYPVALTSSAHAGAAQFLTFLRSQTAQEIFKKYGFTVLQ